MSYDVTMWRWLGALLAVLLTMGALALLAQKFLPTLAATPKHSNRQKNLQVSDSLMIDARRKLVVVRWHETEHLLMLGQDGCQVLDKKKASAPKDTQSKNTQNHSAQSQIKQTKAKS